MRKILVILTLFWISFYPVFAYEAEISIDKDNVFIWDNLKLLIKIKNTDNLENIEILNVNNDLEKNFDIIWRSQSNQIYSQSKMIDWKLEEQREVLTNYTFTLKPKKIWEFTLWPISLSDWTNKKETNLVNVKIIENEVKINSWNKNEKKDFYNSNNDSNLIYYILLTSLLILLLAYIFYYIFNSKKSEKLDKDLEKIDKATQDDFDISLIDINSKDFSNQIEEVLKNKISQQYGILVENKDLSEIIWEIWIFDDKQLLEKINLWINKIKYSDLYFDKNKLFEDVKLFLEKK